MPRILALCVAVLLSGSAVAQTTEFSGPGGLRDGDASHGDQMVSAFAGFITPIYYAYGLGFGFGFRYAYPIMPSGFMPQLNDSFEIEPGIDLGFNSFGFAGGSGTIIAVPVDVRWTFHFSDRLAAYGKAGVGLGFVNYSYSYTLLGTRYASSVSSIIPVINTAVGGLFNITDALALRAEVGTWGLKAGLGFSF
jgi:hypothetical protein